MSHLYPLAANAKEALKAELAALTRYEAEALADGKEIVKLETECITPSGNDIHEIIDAAHAGPGQGFVQRYEDEAGAPVLAVTYWKIGKAVNSKTPAKKPPEPGPSAEDHTDDLYFREGRTKPARKRGRKKYTDPRQMDMFSTGTEPDS